MRKLVVIVIMLITSLLIAGSAVAQSKNLGIGIILGEPTGFSFKAHKGAANAVDAAVAWSLSGDKNLHIHADYLYHKSDVISVEKGSLPLYFGIGGRVSLRENAKDLWGVRIPIGLDYYFDGAPIDIFGELVPTVEVIPDVEFDLEGAIGARFWL